MPQNFFITGMPKAGKTTLLRRLIKEMKSKGLKVGGFVSPEEKHHGTRSAFYVEDVGSGKRAVLASVDGDGPKVSKYHVNVKSFESIALPAMKNIGKYDVVIIDEVGRMEMKSEKFSDLLDKAFEAHTPVIAALHNDYLRRYSFEGEVMMLTQSSREAVFLTLLKKASAEYSKAKMPTKGKPKLSRKPKMKKKAGLKKKAGKKKAHDKARAKASRKAPRENGREEAPAEKPSRRKGILNHFRDFLGF
ncbi:MAG: nucleoside-triphosphatase [Candidatus Micrarchaeota archaeon]